MMDADMERLRRAFFPPETQKQHQVFQTTVKEVDEQNFTCVVREADAVDYFDVRLRSVIDEEKAGVALIPKIGSYVLVGRIGNSNELYIAKFSEIDKIIFTAGENRKISLAVDPEKAELTWGEKVSVRVDEEIIKLTNDQSTVEMKGDRILLNGGDLGGLVLVEKLEQNLNSLKQFVEAMNSALPGALTAIGEGTAANGLAGAKEFSTSMSGKSIQFEKMENNNIKQ